MHPLNHGLTGLAILVLCEKFVSDFYSRSLFWIVFAVLFSMIPDLDSVWKPALIRDHHKSMFHAPLFWLGLGSSIMLIEILIFNQVFGMGFLFTLFTLAHLVCDYVTAREAGIAWLYPFKKKEYSLFPMRPELGDFDFIRSPWHVRKAYYKFYFSNPTLVAFEILVPLASVIIFFV